jgi:predicted secreted hydrolase
MYYYSQPHLVTSGTLQIDNETFVLDPQQSLSWMNRQWTDMELNSSNQWYWADLQLENGIEMDLFQVVSPLTKKTIFKSANIMMPDGSTVYTQNLTYTPRPAPGHKYPQVYDLSIPEINLQVTLTASVPDQDTTGIWEGVNDIQGTYKGQAVKGHGYTENTLR